MTSDYDKYLDTQVLNKQKMLDETRYLSPFDSCNCSTMQTVVEEVFNPKKTGFTCAIEPGDPTEEYLKQMHNGLKIRIESQIISYLIKVL